MSQFEMFHDFVVKQKIPGDKLILLGGDFTEDKYVPNPNNLPPPFEGEYYKEMLQELDATAISLFKAAISTPIIHFWVNCRTKSATRNFWIVCPGLLAGYDTSC
jgi:hypothetical protein